MGGFISTFKYRIESIDMAHVTLLFLLLKQLFTPSNKSISNS